MTGRSRRVEYESARSGGVPGYMYMWDDGDEQTTQTAINLLPGTYNVTVTDSNGCTATGGVEVGLSTQTDDIVNHNVNVFPNPAYNQLFIDVGDHYDHGLSFEIMDRNGRRIINYGFKPDPSNVYEIDISMLESGIYILNLRKDKKTKSLLFVKM